MNLSKLYKKFSFKNINVAKSGLIVLTQDQIDELHSVLLGIADDIFSVCKENNLTCFLSGGTALGAIRHHGFIPWDDDFDLNMPRASFNKFVPLFRKKFSGKYWIHTPQDNPSYGMPICRIRKKNTKFKLREDLFDDTESGAFVDIFIIENVYNNVILKQIQGIACMSTKICLSCRRFYRDRKLMMKAVEYSEDLRSVSLIRLIIGFLCSFMSVEKWTKLTDKIYSMCKNNNSKKVSIPQGRGHFWGEMCDRDGFCNTKNIIFEGREWPVCMDIDDYMKRLYGDNYMEIPPVENREEHLCWEFNLNTE